VLVFRTMHCIHVFVTFQFEFCEFHLVVFIFSWLIVSTLYLFSLFLVFGDCIMF